MADIIGNEDNQSNDDYEDEEDAEDDEATLDEEDALNEEEDDDNELNDLEEDNGLSVEELRRKYYGEKADAADEIRGEEEEADEDEDEGSSSGTGKVIDEVTKNREEPEARAASSYTTRRMGNLRGRLMPVFASASETINQYFKTDDLEEDDSEDYMPPEIWKKEIRVGPEYQVTNIPKMLPISSRKEDKEASDILWIPAPEQCSEHKVMEYLVECEKIRAGEKQKNGPGQKRRDKVKVSSSAPPLLTTTPYSIIPDDENALLALYQAAYDTSKAKSQAPFEYPSLYSANWPRLTQPPGPWRTWSEEDCENFEKGLLEHGKYFWKIRRDFLPNRMVGEIVCFYYSWKKTERFDIWRMEKTQRDQQQQVDVKSTDLMGQIAESILHGENKNPPGTAKRKGDGDMNAKAAAATENKS